jgi:branched-chain amino acid transport system permease protein
MSLELLLQIAANGVMMGSMLITIALGLSLVFGVLRIVNLAHGEIYMLGGMFMWTLSEHFRLNYAVSMFISMVAVGMLGILLERFLFKPFRGDMLGAVMVSVGLILVLQSGALLVFGIEDKGIHTPEMFRGVIDLLGIQFSKQRLFAILVGVVFIVLLQVFLSFSKMGQAIQAVAQDADAASLQGINVSVVSALTMGIGSALAAGAGCIAGSLFQVNAYMGAMPLLEALAIIILGGMGSIPGTIFGGLIIGLLKSFSSTFFGGNMAIMIIFLGIVTFLVVRPSGLFGYAE